MEMCFTQYVIITIPQDNRAILSTDLWAKQDFLHDRTMKNYTKADKLLQIALNMQNRAHLRIVLHAMLNSFNAIQIIRFLQQNLHDNYLDKFMYLFGHVYIYLPARWSCLRRDGIASFVSEFGQSLQGAHDDAFYGLRSGWDGPAVRKAYPYPGRATTWPHHGNYHKDAKHIGIKVEENLSSLDNIETALNTANRGHEEQYKQAKLYWKELLEDKQTFLNYLPFVETFLENDERMMPPKSYNDPRVTIDDWPLGAQINAFMQELNIAVVSGNKKGLHRKRQFGTNQVPGETLNYVNLRRMCSCFLDVLNSRLITAELRALNDGAQRWQHGNEMKQAHEYLNACRHGHVVDVWHPPNGDHVRDQTVYNDFDKGCILPFTDPFFLVAKFQNGKHQSKTEQVLGKKPETEKESLGERERERERERELY